MPKPSLIGPGTDTGNLILQDFKNWRITGFKPWGKGVGGVNHYNSCAKYKVVTASSFRSQAQKIAKIAKAQMPACDCLEDDEIDDAEFGESDNVHSNAEKCPTRESEKQNPLIGINSRIEHDECPPEDEHSQDCNDEDDADYTSSDEGSVSDDALEGFDDIELGELQNSCAPFLSEYPTGDKVLAIFPLDGNVLDETANQFQFIENDTAIRRLGKVPKERLSSVALIGTGTEKESKLGFSDVDLMLIDAEIQKRMKANSCTRDLNGDIWEVRATLQLPYKCKPVFYAKNGKKLSSFLIMKNNHGFAWGYFWLLAWKPSKPKPAKRIGGNFVKTMSKEESSIFTEKTYESKKKRKV